MIYFSGATPGLNPGDVLLPGRDLQSQRPLINNLSWRGHSNIGIGRERMFFSDIIEEAMRYAVAYPRGDVYRVEPAEPFYYNWKRGVGHAARAVILAVELRGVTGFGAIEGVTDNAPELVRVVERIWRERKAAAAVPVTATGPPPAIQMDHES